MVNEFLAGHCSQIWILLETVLKSEVLQCNNRYQKLMSHFCRSVDTLSTGFRELNVNRGIYNNHY